MARRPVKPRSRGGRNHDRSRQEQYADVVHREHLRLKGEKFLESPKSANPKHVAFSREDEHTSEEVPLLASGFHRLVKAL